MGPFERIARPGLEIEVEPALVFSMLKHMLSSSWLYGLLGSNGPSHRRPGGKSKAIGYGVGSSPAASTGRGATGTPSRLASLAKSAPEKLSAIVLWFWLVVTGSDLK